MKKILYSILMLATASTSMAQLPDGGPGRMQFLINEPAEIAGWHDVTMTPPTDPSLIGASNWGYPEMTDPADAISGDFQIVLDASGSGYDICANGVLAGSDFTGKVAVFPTVSGCGIFNMKQVADTLQRLGAEGVLFLTGLEGSILNSFIWAPEDMENGTAITIPLMLASDALVSDLFPVMNGGTAVSGSFGNTYNLYTNNIGFSSDKSGPVSGTFASEAFGAQGDYTIPAFNVDVHNWGTADVTGATVNVVINDGTSDIYDETSAAFDISAGDTAFIDIATAFSPTNLPNGFYTVSYELMMPGGTPDELIGDNFYNVVFEVKDGSYGFGTPRADGVFNTQMFLGPTMYQNSPGSQELCINVEHSNSTNQVATNSMDVLLESLLPYTGGTYTDQLVSTNLYAWNDVIDPISWTPGSGFDNLTPIAAGNAIITEPQLGTYVTIPWESFSGLELVMDADQKYLACVVLDGAGDLIVAGQGETVRSYTNDTYVVYNTPRNPWNNGTDWWLEQWYPFSGRTYVNFTSMMNLNVYDNVSASNEEVTNLVAYPNPANDMVAVTMAGNTGDVTVQVVDLQGKVVLSETKTIANDSVVLETSSLNTGSYIVTVSFENGASATTNLVVAH